MDAGTAQKYHFTVGQTVRILSAGPPRTFTITGITEFGTANNLAGATLAAFTLPTAQAITQSIGKLDAINVVTASGASKATVQQAIAKALPPGAEVPAGPTVLRIGGIYQANALIGSYLVSAGFFLAHFPRSLRARCCCAPTAAAP